MYINVIDGIYFSYIKIVEKIGYIIDSTVTMSNMTTLIYYNG